MREGGLAHHEVTLDGRWRLELSVLSICIGFVL